MSQIYTEELDLRSWGRAEPSPILKLFGASALALLLLGLFWPSPEPLPRRAVPAAVVAPTRPEEATLPIPITETAPRTETIPGPDGRHLVGTRRDTPLTAPKRSALSELIGP